MFQIRSYGTENKWQWICCIGPHIDALILIMRDISIPFVIYNVEDNNFGSFKNGSWNGMVNDLYVGKADISMQSLTITSERLQVSS